jgi:hypothetical protein
MTPYITNKHSSKHGRSLWPAQGDMILTVPLPLLLPVCLNYQTGGENLQIDDTT